MQTHRTLLPAIAATLSLAFAQAGVAQDKAAPATEPRKKVDLDGDGKISRDEAKGYARLEKGFDRIDTNKDGFLSRDELAAARKAAEAKKQP